MERTAGKSVFDAKSNDAWINERVNNEIKKHTQWLDSHIIITSL